MHINFNIDQLFLEIEESWKERKCDNLRWYLSQDFESKTLMLLM